MIRFESKTASSITKVSVGRVIFHPPTDSVTEWRKSEDIDWRLFTFVKVLFPLFYFIFIPPLNFYLSRFKLNAKTDQHMSIVWLRKFILPFFRLFHFKNLLILIYVTSHIYIRVTLGKKESRWLILLFNLDVSTIRSLAVNKLYFNL